MDTMTESHLVAEKVLEDLAGGGARDAPAAVFRDVVDKHERVVDWEGWGRIDAEERARGEWAGKPREKITDVRTMLEVAHRDGQGV